MAKNDYRKNDEQGGKPEVEARVEVDRFPDKALVRAFAEDLLRKGQQGSYQPVESQRRRTAAPQRGVDRDELAAELDPRHTPLGPPSRAEGVQAVTLKAHDPGALSDSLDDASDGCDECLSEDSILAFVQGTLTGAELVRTHRHLDICPHCQRLIVEAVHAISTSRRESAASDPQGSALRIGTVLGNRYRIQRFVARGGMGEVYEAYDRTLRERVALKTVMPTVSDSPRAVRRLMAEVQLSRRVSHPNVCRIYDLGAERVPDGDRMLHFLTMEFVEGSSLAQELERNGPLKVDEAVDTARQLLSGLQAAHEAGILHRDFKPDNIMLRPTNGSRQRAVIMDFGLARAMDVDPARLTTGANQPLIGTLTYMAPEQVEGGDLTAGTDIFAFGIVFFEMLTGCVPFVGGSPAATALKRLKEDPPGPAEFAPNVPKHINRIVLKCLARHPDKRYTSAAEVLAALDEEPQARLSTAEKPRRWHVLAGLGAAVLVALLFWIIVPDSAQPPAPAGPDAQEPSLPPKTESVVVRVDPAQQETARKEPSPASQAARADSARVATVARDAHGEAPPTDSKPAVSKRLPPVSPPASASSAGTSAHATNAPGTVNAAGAAVATAQPSARPTGVLMVPSIFGQPPLPPSSVGSAPHAEPAGAGSRANPP